MEIIDGRHTDAKIDVITKCKSNPFICVTNVLNSLINSVPICHNCSAYIENYDKSTKYVL